jgi:hypothetical protein
MPSIFTIILFCKIIDPNFYNSILSHGSPAMRFGINTPPGIANSPFESFSSSATWAI